MKWPWISREHHAAVVAGKDALIALLEDQNTVLAERLAEPIAVTVTLPEDFAIAQPAQIRRPRPKDEASPNNSPAGSTPAPISWDSIDENDLVTIAKIAAQELGGNVNPYVLSRKVESIKSQIRHARRKKNAETPTSGRVGTIAAPTSDAETQYVPSFIRDMIAEAEKV
jgi:hypothetical protein